MEGQIISETKRLNIRQFTLKDTDQIYKLSLESGIKRWMPDQVYNSRQAAADTLQYLIDQYDRGSKPEQNPYVLGLELKKGQELIGHVGLSPYQDIVEIGYAVGDKYQGLGYATEAVLKFSKWALENINLDVIWAVVNKENEASIKVLEKANYEYIDEEKNKFCYKFSNGKL